MCLTQWKAEAYLSSSRCRTVTSCPIRLSIVPMPEGLSTSRSLEWVVKESLLAQRNVERLETHLIYETRLVCDSRADRHRLVVASDAALVKEEITRALVGEDPAVPRGLVKGLNCSVFQREKTSLNLMNEGQRGACITQTRFQRSG